MATRGRGAKPRSYSAQGLVADRTEREGNEHLPGSILAPGREPSSSTDGQPAPNLFLFSFFPAMRHVS